MESPRDGPGEVVQAHWDDLRADIDALQEEYETEGWTVQVVHPGEITPMRGDESDQAVLIVLVPDNELAAVRDLVEGAGFERVDVYQQTADGTVFLVVVLLSPEAETAVIYPAYYTVPAADELLEAARREGVLRVRFRNLAKDDAVLVEHAEPEPFFPD